MIPLAIKRTVVSFFLLSILLLAVFSYRIGMCFFGSELDYQGEAISVQIPSGTSTSDIARILEEKGIIKNALYLRMYLRYSGPGQTLQAGSYSLYPDMHPGDVVEILQEGRVYREQITFTIPEGLMSLQIAERLELAGLGDKGVFLQLMASPEKFAYNFLEEIPAGLEYPLEGYLFPDTYNVHTDAGEKEVLETMLKRFSAFYTDDVRNRLEKVELTLHEAVTLASIVEREAQAPHEREVIAGVFHNRLEKSWPLQADPTVLYAAGEIRSTIYQSDLDRDSPYNTYRYAGLPPGPIASPGQGALLATLYPKEVDYMFFVAKYDGTGEHFFAVSLGEHNANVSSSRENRRK